MFPRRELYVPSIRTIFTILLLLNTYNVHCQSTESSIIDLTRQSPISPITTDLTEQSPISPITTDSIEQSPTSPITTGLTEQSPTSPITTGLTEQSPTSPITTGLTEQSPTSPSFTGSTEQSPIPPSFTGSTEQPPTSASFTGSTEQPSTSTNAGTQPSINTTTTESTMKPPTTTTLSPCYPDKFPFVSTCIEPSENGGVVIAAFILGIVTFVGTLGVTSYVLFFRKFFAPKRSRMLAAHSTTHPNQPTARKTRNPARKTKQLSTSIELDPL